ncbi:Fic/DOC family protein [Sabulibacter ruber]|uniref:Fic/DOC family protein n=1 Tax=Sabulibacter ruber TaxID=2811901 RepID=UPI001A95733E|nr:Fic family protein [Sabulibacter ruber]
MAIGDGFSDEHGVLINHKGIQDRAELARLENKFAAFKAAILKEEGGIPGSFDQKHLQAIHRELFGSVYPWAGETRAERGGFQGIKETAVQLIPQEMKYAPFQEIGTRLQAISSQLEKENFLKGLGPDAFSQRAAFYLDQYNHVHAFREGNGRTLQAMFTQLGREAGYDINFHHADPAKYNEVRNYALVKPHAPHESGRNLAPLAAFLREVSRPIPGAERSTGLESGRDRIPEPSPEIKRIEILRELEVTGGRIADRWDILVKQQVKDIVEDPRHLKKHDKPLRMISKAILEGIKPSHYLYQDAERFTKALDQVRALTAGKEIPTPRAALAEQSPSSELPKSHKEAQGLFIRASTWLSQELRNNGKEAEGEKLQHVARFVSRVPFIGGMNHEYINTALEASSRIPKLKECNPVRDILCAVQVLNKPENRLNKEVAGKERHLDRGGLER